MSALDAREAGTEVGDDMSHALAACVDMLCQQVPACRPAVLIRGV